MSDLNQRAIRTYERESRRRDAGLPHRPPEQAARRAVQDAAMTEQHRAFDRQAKDRTMKYERPKFAVVGEGTKSAQDNYRRGWERIFGGRKSP